MAIKKEVLDELLKDADPKKLFHSQGLFDELKKALAERALNAEIEHHLASESAEAQSAPEDGGGSGNHRNGYSKKSVLTDTGKIEVSIPRDRLGSFEPQLIAKYQRRLPGFDDKIVSMYARGMSVREIQGHLLELYGLEVSPELVSTVTDAVLDEVVEWQNRPLEASYAIVFFDALRVKIRDEGTVKNKAIYLAVGVRTDGRKEVLGIWIESSEIRNRGTADILIAVVDGLKGFPEAISAVFPQTQVQTCIVHLIRNSLAFASWKERKPIAAGLKPIYRAETAEIARERLEAFDAGPWGQKYPAIAAAWRRHWSEVIPFFSFPQEVRRIVYTTNAIESLHSTIRRSVRSRGHFPSDESATKLIWLVLRNVTADWKMPPISWHAAKAQFAIVFGDRFNLSA
jgi:putative transposase